MKSKLGLHHNTVQDAPRLEEFYRVAQPVVALHLDLGNTWLPRMIRAVSPDTVIVFRKWFSSQPLGDPENNADSAVRGILDTACGREGLIDLAVIYNEIGPHPTHDYMRFDIRATQRLHEAGIGAAVGSWSVGTPDVPDWESTWFTETLRVADYLSMHEYCAPSMDDPRGGGWFTLRYEHMLRSLRTQNLGFHLPPIILTECGIDSGATHWDAGAQGGWRSFTTPQDYLRQLAWYDDHIRQEDLIVGACIFCVHDQSGDWTTFDVRGEMLDLLQNYMVEQQQDGNPIHPYPDWITDLRDVLPKAGEYGRRGLGAVQRVVVHHSDAPPSVGPWQIAEYHVGVKGWPGHGYHFDVGVDGQVWQCQDLESVSYHAGDANADSVGVCLLGDYVGGGEPPDSQLDGVRKVMDYVEQVVGRELGVFGHREVMADRVCPGDTFLGPGGWKERLLGEEEFDWRMEADRLSELLAEIEEIAEER